MDRPLTHSLTHPRTHPLLLSVLTGYGTRLQRDLERAGPEWQHLRGVAKALLPMAGKPLATHWLDVFHRAGLLSSSTSSSASTSSTSSSTESPTTVTATATTNTKNNRQLYVVTNQHFYPDFLRWAQENDVPPANILNDGTTTNESRLGATADIRFAVDRMAWSKGGGGGRGGGGDASDNDDDDSVLVVAGDTLLYRDFPLGHVQAEYGRLPPGSCLVTYYQCSDADTTKTGILRVDCDTTGTTGTDTGTTGTGRVQGFLEKPGPDDTPLRNACPCVYWMHRTVVQQWLPRFLDEATTMQYTEQHTEHQHETTTKHLHETTTTRQPLLDHYDATGKFLAWLWSRCPVYARPIAGRLDVGDLASYIEADRYMRDGPDNIA